MSSGQGGPHPLAFRVMRLCKPSFQVDPIPLLLDPADLVVGEDVFDDPMAAAQLPRLLDVHDSLNPSSSASSDSSDLTYRTRFLLHHPSDSIGLSGLLVLPQAFGAIYLGETFCSYISINNSSNFEVKDIIIKSEMQTERQRLVLLDTSNSPVESIRAGGRYDFIVEHDVKELGAHSLVCTALYYDGDGERKYLPQFFKFIVSNPLSVRTKVLVIKEITLLEACIENHTKSNLFMEQVEFEPAQHWSAKILKSDEHHSEKNSQTKEIFKPPILIKSGGGIHNYLYQLTSHGSSQGKVEGSNILGKLQITWRTNLGEPGRLQTQQIMGTAFRRKIPSNLKVGSSNMPITRKDIELHVVEEPSAIKLERPFSLHLNLANETDKELGPFKVCLSQDDSREENVVVIIGLQTVVLPRVEAFSSTKFKLNLIATKLGVQRITGITVFNIREKKSYDPLPDMEIFVDLD